MTPEPRDENGHSALEKAAQGLPKLEPQEAVWSRVESELRNESAQPGNRSSALMEFLRWRPGFSRRPEFSYALYGVIVMIGIATSMYLLLETKHPMPSEESMNSTPSSEEMLLDAQDDIDQAIFFYERAIDKLTALAAKNQKNLNPQFVSLQSEKINLLRQSVIDCKTALVENKSHPQVQHYLLTAYNDLQTALQEMATRTN